MSCGPRGKSHRTACTRAGASDRCPANFEPERGNEHVALVYVPIYIALAYTPPRGYEEKTEEERPEEALVVQLPGCCLIAHGIRETEFSPALLLLELRFPLRELVTNLSRTSYGLFYRIFEIWQFRGGGGGLREVCVGNYCEVL